MKRPTEVDQWEWEFPGYWSHQSEDRVLTVGDMGVNIHTKDLSEVLDSLGSEENPLDVKLVELHDALERHSLGDQFLAVVYLGIQGHEELKARGLDWQ